MHNQISGGNNTIRLGLVAAVLLSASSAYPVTVNRWRDLVANCAETLITKGTDQYGAVTSDMFVSILDVDTHVCPENPEWLDTEAYYEVGRAHRRAMAGANFWYDQPTIKAMYRLSDVTGNQFYADGANRAVDSFFDHAIRPGTNMPAWGTHTFYNVFEDQFDGDGQHETLVYDAQWDRLYDRRPAQTQAAVDGIWARHLVDPATGQFNRHDDNQVGCDFAFSGGSFIKAMASMYNETGNSVYLDRALTLTEWHWSHRNTTTNLIPDAPSTYPRYDSTHCFTTITGPYADQLFEAYDLTGETTFRDRAVTYLKAYDQYAWDEEAQSYWAMLELDGTPVPEQPQGSGYDAWAPYGHVDPWKTTIYSYEFPLNAAQSYARGYALTGDPDLLTAATRWATVIDNALPVQLGERFGDVIAAALPNIAQTGGSYAEDYGRVVSFYTQMYSATGNNTYLQTAELVAQDAANKLYTNNIFRGHAAIQYYETTKGVGVLLDALMDLDAVSDKRPVVEGPIQQTFEATTDVWVRETFPNQTYENDLVSVWGQHNVEGQRYGLLEFDIGNLKGNISSVRLETFAPNSTHNQTAFAQKAVLLLPSDVENATWGNYQAFQEISLESLGALRFENGGVQTDRYFSSKASAADLQAFQDYIAQTGGKVAIGLKPEEMHIVDTVPNGRREWADLEYYRDGQGQACPPQLVINGGEYVLTATEDGWVRETHPDTFYESDLVSVWGNKPETYSSDYGQRYGLLSFDLSGISTYITDAVLQLYTAEGWDHHNKTDFEQHAFILDGQALTDITWDSYSSLSESALEGLGYYLLGADAETGIYYDSLHASAADLALLEAIRTGDGELMLSLKAFQEDLVLQDEYYCGERDWADLNYVHGDGEGRPPRLIINLNPFDGDANLDGNVDVSDLGILATNYGVGGGLGWENADFNGDGIVDVSDLGILATNYGVHSQAASVPEPSILAGLLGLCLAGLQAKARRRVG